MKKENKSQKDNINNELNEMIYKLKEIFEYYCSYGERLNTNILKSHKFIKLFKESGIKDNIVNQTRLELIYKSENKYNCMNFEQFLNALMKVAEYKYPNYSSPIELKKNLKQMIKENILPLYDLIINGNFETTFNNSILSTTIIQQLDNIDNILYSNICEEILTSIIPILFEIYKVYFPHEISISDNIEYIKNNSIKQYNEFIKDFDISPGLLSKSVSFQIYKSEVANENSDISISNNKNFYQNILKNLDIDSILKYEPNNPNILGQHFIFIKFIRALIKMSQIAFAKLENTINLENSIKKEEMIIMFFQKIELSEGFTNMQKKTNKTHNEKQTMIIQQDLLDKINMELNGEINEETNNNKSTFQSNLKKFENYEPEYSNYINEIYGNHLLNIFKGMCNFGDQFNYKNMKSKSFMKFLKDSGLIKLKENNNFGLEMNLIDTLFIKLSLLNSNIKTNEKENIINTVNNSKAFIDFDTFLIGIEIISRIIYPNLEIKDAIDKIINENIIPNNINNVNIEKIREIDEKIDNLKELQNSEDFIQILEITHKAITPIFNYYSKDTNNYMTRENFLKFCKDYEIFPSLMSQSKLNGFFIGISQYSQIFDDNNILIEQSLFIDLLTLIALDIIYPQPEPNPVEKILVLMEKIAQSNGNSLMISKTGSNRIGDSYEMLDEFRKYYPEYFESKTKKKETFMDIMNLETEN
jgi:hypothetical protein